MQDQSELVAAAIAVVSANRVVFELLCREGCQSDGNGRVRGVEGAHQLLIPGALKDALAIACGDGALLHQDLNACYEVRAPAPYLVCGARGDGDLEEAYAAEVVSGEQRAGSDSAVRVGHELPQTALLSGDSLERVGCLRVWRCGVNGTRQHALERVLADDGEAAAAHLKVAAGETAGRYGDGQAASANGGEGDGKCASGLRDGNWRMAGVVLWLTVAAGGCRVLERDGPDKGSGSRGIGSDAENAGLALDLRHGDGIVCAGDDEAIGIRWIEGSEDL